MNVKINKYFLSYLAQFFLEWEMFQQKLKKKSKYTFNLGNNFFKSRDIDKIM